MCCHFCAFGSEELTIHLPRTHPPLRIPKLPIQLVFENAAWSRFTIQSEESRAEGRVLRGGVTGTGLRFEAEWRWEPAGWIRCFFQATGEPDPSWGRFQRLVLLDEDMPTQDLRSHLGWREAGGTSGLLADRPPEEGGGLQPPFGFPIFGPDFFLGAEHPMACVEAQGGRAQIFHHPLWQEGVLRGAPLVIGLCASDESPEQTFARYFETIRLPAPERAIVEINTFWTDAFRPPAQYDTDLASYRAMARCWFEDILHGQSGLVSHFLLDAGWQNPASLYRPQASLGGPEDATLAELGRDLEACGFSLGLWFSLNGPIGIDMDWAEAEGYRVSNEGIGAGYSCGRGNIRYVCLTDTRWEESLAARFEELITHVPVTFFKGDWDNDAIEDPVGFPASQHSKLQLREAIANAMLRIYGRMRAARPGVALRGAWWLSPWWFPHVNNTHLPNSGDHENSDIPSLTQRDSGITCRDAVYYQVMKRSETPVAWDVICPHEFARARRNPVQDTEDSWMNNLAMWVSRGTHYLQLYVTPYGLDPGLGWSLREMLRWFRAHEDLLWKSGTAMLGGNPLEGAVYAYHHQEGERHLLTIRNPLAHPQSLPDSICQGDGWEQMFPYCRSFSPLGYRLGSHEVIILAKGGPSIGGSALINTPAGWRKPWSEQSIPQLHGLDAPSAAIERLSPRKLAVHATLPYGLSSAEVVLAIRSPGRACWRAGVGRYPEDVATFGVPVTCARPHWQGGFTQSRLKVPRQDPTKGVLRFPIGTGGSVHAFLAGEEELPEIQGAWIEARASLRPVETPPTLCRPPAMSHPSQCLLEIPI